MTKGTGCILEEPEHAKLYGIRHKETKRPIGISASSNNGADFCGDISVTIDPTGDDVYCVRDIALAKEVLKQDVKWYNSSLGVPCWPRFGWDPKQYEVFMFVAIGLAE